MSVSALQPHAYICRHGFWATVRHPQPTADRTASLRCTPPDRPSGPSTLSCQTAAAPAAAGARQGDGAAGAECARPSRPCVCRLRRPNRRVRPLRAMPSRLLPGLCCGHVGVPHVSMWLFCCFAVLHHLGLGSSSFHPCIHAHASPVSPVQLPGTHHQAGAHPSGGGAVHLPPHPAGP